MTTPHSCNEKRECTDAFGTPYDKANALYDASLQGNFLYDEMVDYFVSGTYPWRFANMQSKKRRGKIGKFKAIAKAYSIDLSNEKPVLMFDPMCRSEKAKKVMLSKWEEDVSTYTQRSRLAGRKLIVLRKGQLEQAALQEHAAHHGGVNKMEERLNCRYRAKGIRQICTRVCNACVPCAEKKKVLACDVLLSLKLKNTDAKESRRKTHSMHYSRSANILRFQGKGSKAQL